jgi:tRNA pseudouridine38-40 synthase
VFYYKLVIAYDGYDYHGWQWQPNDITVAGQLEKSFSKVFGKKLLSLVGASRTDAGVHAWGQVARLKIDFVIDADKLKKAWQGALPATIMLREVTQMAGDFDLQEGVVSKTYDYYISTSRMVPFLARYCIAYYPSFDMQLLQKNLNVFLGTHDFRSFCTGDDKECTVRTIDSISVSYLKRYTLYRVRVKGPGFLRYMVRRVIGASLQTMSMQLDNELADAVAVLHAVLQEKDPHQNLKTAPAHALMLRSIEYRK